MLGIPLQPKLLTILGVVCMGSAALAADSSDLGQIEQAFVSRGIGIQWNHPRCREVDLFGMYLRVQRLVVVCPRGNQRETLMHEGWHAIQSLCLNGAPLLPVEDMLRRLSSRDRRELQLLYQPQQWQREGEARLMATQSLDRYLKSVDDACKETEFRTRFSFDSSKSGLP
jgi:hypothetical protein